MSVLSHELKECFQTLPGHLVLLPVSVLVVHLLLLILALLQEVRPERLRLRRPPPERQVRTVVVLWYTGSRVPVPCLSLPVVGGPGTDGVVPPLQWTCGLERWSGVFSIVSRGHL